MTVSKKRIYTHQHIDLDAAASVWLYLRFVDAERQVVFRPANWDGRDAEADAAILDLDCGLKGEKGADGRVHACFATLVRRHVEAADREALRPLVDLIDLQDSTGDAIRALGVTAPQAVEVLSATGLNGVLSALRLRYPTDDQPLLERMCEIFDGLLELGRSRIRAEREARAARWVGEVAIVQDAREHGTKRLLFEQGAVAVVYRDGNDLGAVRGDDRALRLDHPAIRALVAAEPGWFFHPAGFLAARGTRKAPARTPSRIDPEELARAILALRNQDQATCSG
jgi:hypothetical protein